MFMGLTVSICINSFLPQCAQEWFRKRNSRAAERFPVLPDDPATRSTFLSHTYLASGGIHVSSSSIAHITGKGKAMKLLSCALLLMASMAFVLAGCSDKSDSLLTPKEQPTATGSSLAKGGPVVHAATGSMHLYPEGETKMRTFAFTAKQYKDGSFDGEYQVYRHASGAANKWHGKVIYLNVKDNKALIIGYEDHQTGAWLGTYDAFIAIDNGEGTNASPDIMSFVWYTDNPTELANWMTMDADEFVQHLLLTWPDPITIEDILYPVQMGNIQVH
jgi:hypothetical protein